MTPGERIKTRQQLARKAMPPPREHEQPTTNARTTGGHANRPRPRSFVILRQNFRPRVSSERRARRQGPISLPAGHDILPAVRQEPASQGVSGLLLDGCDQMGRTPVAC
jgi:hypothetical protein